MLLVGLTGGIGSGKSTVANALAAHGAVVVDADVLARQVVEPGTPGFAAVVARFGPEVVAADGGLDRAALARLVFADDAARRDLNGIVHPLVAAATQARV
ncbi:MAG: dephospho-CoA kinase, partial [Acidimicrobiales bacterium]